MKSKRFFWFVAAITLQLSALIPASTYAQRPSENIYAQHLIEVTLKKHPEVVTLAMHVTPPNSADNVIIASNFGSLGKKADSDDLGVLKSGQPRMEVGKNGDRFSVELPLHDASRNTVGVLAVAFPYKPGENKAKFLKIAERVRDELARRIYSVANLIEPFPYDAKIPTNTYAQYLVDQALARHPEAIILAMHVTPPKTTENVIIASNIGRIGKKADEDDLKVIETGKPNVGPNPAGDRYEVELPLQDVSHDTIGALGVVFLYKNGDDTARLQKQAEQIRDELRRRVTFVANLLDPNPYSELPTNTYAQKLVDETSAKHPDLQILALHITLPGGSRNVILASTIGRIGKKADEDDMKVIETGDPLLEVHVSGKRFEVELQLHDRSGKTIGAVSEVFAYKPGDDKDQFRKRAELIRAEIEKKIPSAAKLLEPAE
jgi:hypothetical protein